MWRGPGLRLASVLMLAFAWACTPTATATEAVASEQTPPYIQPDDSWIEVDLGRQMVLLHEGRTVIAEYPASTGLATDPAYATPPGLYRVQQMEKGPIESVPGVFVSDVIIFDLGKGNGLHSRPTNAEGEVLDPTLGAPATAGCVRVSESAHVFMFAEVGMRIWIH